MNKDSKPERNSQAPLTQKRGRWTRGQTRTPRGKKSGWGILIDGGTIIIPREFEVQRALLPPFMAATSQPQC